MKEITSYPHGAFCWYELATTDFNAAKNFYSNVFGWDAQMALEQPGMEYLIFTKEGKAIGGLYNLQPPQKEMNLPPHWMPYVNVNSIEDALQAATAAGGNVIMPATEVMEHGRMAIIADPEGGVVSLWQAKNMAGTEIADAHGAPSWNEYASKEPSRSIPFYESVFGWKGNTNNMGGMDYTTFASGENMAAGLWQMPEEMRHLPTHWLTYFTVEGLDAALAKASENGGEVLAPKMYVEGVGYFAVVRDPQGAALGLISEKE